MSLLRTATWMEWHSNINRLMDYIAMNSEMHYGLNDNSIHDGNRIALMIMWSGNDLYLLQTLTLRAHSALKTLP